MANSFQSAISDYGALGNGGTYTMDGQTSEWTIDLNISPLSKNIIFLFTNITSATSPNFRLSFSNDGNPYTSVFTFQPQTVPGNVSVFCYTLQNDTWFIEGSAGSSAPTVSSSSGVPTSIKIEPIDGTPPETIDTMKLTIFYQ